MYVRPAWEMDLLLEGMRGEGKQPEDADELATVPRDMARVPKGLREAFQ